MKRVLASFVLLASICHAATWYVTQAGAGAANGHDLADAWSVVSYNASTTSTAAGDVVFVSGTITSQIVIPNGGSLGSPITINLSAANLTSPAWSAGGAIAATGKNYVTIDGGGPLRGGTGIIQNTANGTNLANQVAGARGIYALHCAYFVVKNLTIANMYVHVSGSDTAPLTSCACVTNNDDFGEGIEGFTVTNCILHDAATGIDSDYNAGDSNYTFSFNTIYNCNWGGRCGDRSNTSTMTGLVVHDNNISQFTNWNTPGDTYHHNGFYAWSEQANNMAGMTNPVFYNNVIGPGLGGGNQTSCIYCSAAVGTMNGTSIYNNLFLANPGEYASPGLAVLVGPGNQSGSTGLGDIGTHNWYNNTFICGSASGAAMLIDGGSNAATLNIYNNLCNGDALSTFISILLNGNLTNNINNNLGYSLSATNPYYYSATSSGVSKSYAQWQALGFDTNGVTSNPLLNASYTPASGSPARAAGSTSTLTLVPIDASNHARPSTPAIGAYEYYVSGLSALAPGGVAVMTAGP